MSTQTPFLVIVVASSSVRVFLPFSQENQAPLTIKGTEQLYDEHFVTKIS